MKDVKERKKANIIKKHTYFGNFEDKNENLLQRTLVALVRDGCPSFKGLVTLIWGLGAPHLRGSFPILMREIFWSVMDNVKDVTKKTRQGNLGIH